MSTGLGLALFAFAVLFVAGVYLVGRGPTGAERPAFVVGAISTVVAAILALLAAVLLPDSVGNLVSPLVCQPGERFETVWTQSIANGRRRNTGELHCSGPGGHRPTTYFAPFVIFFDGGLVLCSALGAVAVGVAASRRKQRTR